MNSTENENTGGGGYGFFLSMVLVIGFIAFLFFYGMPFITRSLQQTPTIQVPDKVDVNVNMQEQK
jgi:hypothetical protein